MGPEYYAPGTVPSKASRRMENGKEGGRCSPGDLTGRGVYVRIALASIVVSAVTEVR